MTSIPATIESVKGYFHKELNGIFDQEEVDALFFCSLEYYLGYTRTNIFLISDEIIPESEYELIKKTVERLKAGEPLQYILGESWFYGLKLKLNKNVLIPRPETEELVEWVLQNLNVANSEDRGLTTEVRGSTTEDTKFTILDIGTGSGCIAIALKKSLPQIEVFALDISIEALDMARQNALLNKADIHFIQGDIIDPDCQNIIFPIFDFSALDHFNIIISNPPYILPSEKRNMKRNVLEHEPHLALFVSENDPLQYYKAIANFAKKILSPDGKLFLEINETRALDMQTLLQENGFNTVETKKDLSGKDRMMKAQFV